MKKLFGMLAVLALMAAVFSGCQPKKEVSIDVNTLADDLKNSINFVDELSESKDKAFFTVYGLDESDIKVKKNYVGSATSEEITVIEAVDENAAQRVNDAVEAHLADYIEQFEDYAPDQVPKLRDPIFEKIGKYVILCVSDDNETAKKTIDKYTK